MKKEEETTFLESKEESDKKSSSAYLIVIKGPSVGKKYKIFGTMTVGRSEKEDIFIDQSTISRKHAEVILHETGKATVNDLTSRNGTFYKGKRIKSVEIFDGEQIEFGNVTCKFVTDINAEGNLLDFASVDDMTKTYNKRYFNEIISAEFKKALNNKSTLSLIMIDIDRFKKINDSYGHSAGDFILKTMCAKISTLLTGNFTFARIGGEEFAILAPDMKKQDAYDFAEKLRIEIERYEFIWNNITIPVTLSLGVCERTEDVKDLNEFIHKTDSLLYLAKNTGRNRVCV